MVRGLLEKLIVTSLLNISPTYVEHVGSEYAQKNPSFYPILYELIPINLSYSLSLKFILVLSSQAISSPEVFGTNLVVFITLPTLTAYHNHLIPDYTFLGYDAV